MPTLLELAAMSEAVYNEDGAVKRGKLVKDKRGILDNWSCLELRSASGSLSGFQGAIFLKQGETVVAFRGSSQAVDWYQNAKFGAGMNTKYFALGEELANFALGSRITVTGHSLGGAIAQVVANRGGYPMATFNAPGVAVILSRNILKSNAKMNKLRIKGMLASTILHPQQAISDVKNMFRIVKGINLCLKGDAVSQMGNHYGRVMRIPGLSINPVTEHKMKTVIDVLERPENTALARRSPTSF